MEGLPYQRTDGPAQGLANWTTPDDQPPSYEVATASRGVDQQRIEENSRDIGIENAQQGGSTLPNRLPGVESLLNPPYLSQASPGGQHQGNRGSSNTKNSRKKRKRRAGENNLPPATPREDRSLAKRIAILTKTYHHLESIRQGRRESVNLPGLQSIVDRFADGLQPYRKDEEWDRGLVKIKATLYEDTSYLLTDLYLRSLVTEGQQLRKEINLETWGEELVRGIRWTRLSTPNINPLTEGKATAYVRYLAHTVAAKLDIDSEHLFRRLVFDEFQVDDIMVPEPPLGDHGITVSSPIGLTLSDPVWGSDQPDFQLSLPKMAMKSGQAQRFRPTPGHPPDYIDPVEGYKILSSLKLVNSDEVERVTPFVKKINPFCPRSMLSIPSVRTLSGLPSWTTSLGSESYDARVDDQDFPPKEQFSGAWYRAITGYFLNHVCKHRLAMEDLMNPYIKGFALIIPGDRLVPSPWARTMFCIALWNIRHAILDFLTYVAESQKKGLTVCHCIEEYPRRHTFLGQILTRRLREKHDINPDECKNQPPTEGPQDLPVESVLLTGDTSRRA